MSKKVEESVDGMQYMRYKVACERCTCKVFKIGIDDKNEAMHIECCNCGILDWLCNFKKGQTGVRKGK